jgi:SnoaL-like domain
VGEFSGSQLQSADRIEIESLMKRYCLYFDTKRSADLASLFTAHARIDYGPEIDPVIGREKLKAMVSEGHATRFESTSHQICNEIVTFIDGVTAEGTSHLYAWHKYFDSETIGHLYGGYRYRFTKEDSEWKIAALKLYASGIDGFHRSTMHDFRTILDDKDF